MSAGAEPAILTLNAGSSSIKFALFRLAATPADIARAPRIVGQVDGLGVADRRAHLRVRDTAGQLLHDGDLPEAAGTAIDHRAALTAILDWLDRNDNGLTVEYVGHRVVHGGREFAVPVRIDDTVLDRLHTLIPLAPLHQPHNLAGIAAVAQARPDLPQVACFDTAFHYTQPALAQQFALPRRLTEAGIRRYGFHGLSYEYIAQALTPTLPEAVADGRVIVAHLGNGASMCALANRRSTATTMGFTAIDGLMMGTRCGNLDPGVVLHLLEAHGLDARALTRLLYHESGLLGVSGISADMRTLLASDAAQADEAIALYCYRIVREIGSLAAALGGLDAIVFTGGIGEHAAPIRSRICADLEWLGAKIDDSANAASAARIDCAGSRLPLAIIPTNEEWMIARHTAEILG